MSSDDKGANEHRRPLDLELRVATRVPVILAFAMFAVGLVGSLTAFVTLDSTLFLVCWIGGMVAATLGAVLAPMLLSDPRYVGRRGPVTADMHGVHLRGALFLGRDRIGASYREGRRIHLVSLDLSELMLVAATEDDAAEAARRIGLGGGETIARFRATSLALRRDAFWVAAVLTGALVLAIPDLRATPSIAIPPIALLLLLANLPTVVVVGRDGVIVRWLWIRRRLPLDGVRAVERRRLGVALRYGGDRTAEIAIGPSARAEALRLRIGEAVAGRDPGDGDTHSNVLARDGLSMKSWLAALRARAAEPSTYRAASIPQETLWRVAESASAPPEQRVAAAAIVAEGDASARARLLRVGRAVAHPELRKVLVALASGEDADERDLDRLVSNGGDEGEARRRAT